MIHDHSGLRRLVEHEAQGCGSLTRARNVWARKVLEWLAASPENYKQTNLRVLHEAFNDAAAPDSATFHEAGGIMISQQFALITGNIIQRAIQEGFDLTSLHVVDRLVSPFDSAVAREVWTNIQAIEDKKKDTGLEEGEEYPIINVKGEKSVSPPEPKKKGYVMALTEEMQMFNRIGNFLDNGRKLGEKLARNRELRILKGITDIFKRYYPQNKQGDHAQVDLYRTAAGTSWFNRHITEIVNNMTADETCLQAAMDSFATRLDEDGEVIGVRPTAILVGQARSLVAKKLLRFKEFVALNGSDTRRIAGSLDAAGIIGTTPDLVISPLLDSFGSPHHTTWYIGDPKRCFFEQVHMPLTVIPGMPNSEDAFDRDITMKFKARYKSDLLVANDDHWLKCTAA